MPKQRWSDREPFHVVQRKVDTAHRGYDIFCKNRPFLRQVTDDPAFDAVAPPLKRHEAYAIVRVLNGQRDLRKWAEKFDDPYV